MKITANRREKKKKSAQTCKIMNEKGDHKKINQRKPHYFEETDQPSLCGRNDSKVWH